MCAKGLIRPSVPLTSFFHPGQAGPHTPGSNRELIRSPEKRRRGGDLSSGWDAHCSFEGGELIYEEDLKESRVSAMGDQPPIMEKDARGEG